ncbi:MAG: preprotein translocase subunit SecG [Planctomycetota bacterium]|nr:preprotein translocase subunit SecG [Planctomycetota bacterium]
MLTFLMVVLGIVTVLMALAILLQEPKQAGLSGAFGLGGSEQMLGTSTTSGIARFTMVLSVAFFLLCITVGLMARDERGDSRLTSDPIEPGIGALEPGGIGISEGLPGDVVGTDEAIDDAIDDAPGTGTPADAAPVDDAPADDAPADDAPADDAPADDAPADDAPADDAPADDAPAGDAPAVDTPATAPADTGGSDETGGTGN